MAGEKLKLTFLGTNGWYATHEANTVCALIETGGRYIVLDAGDGIQHLDEVAKDENKPVDIFLSHFHLDHTIGLHIQPKFHFKNKIRIFGQPGTKKILSILVSNPFTAPFSLLEKKGLQISVHELKEGENDLGGYVVRAAPLIHADPSWGFRFEFEKEKKIISYCTDTGPCDNLSSLSKNADALITECSLLPGEKISPSWPHLNPETAASIAGQAGCKKLYLTHFGSNKYFGKKDRQNAQDAARKIFPNSYATSDGMEVLI